MRGEAEQWTGAERLMATLYLTEEQTTVKIEGEALRLQMPRGQERQVVRVPLAKVDQVVVLGNITLTTPALQALLERGIAVHYLSARGRSYGSLVADWGKNSGPRLALYALYTDLPRRFAAARQCVAGKLINMRAVLLRYARNREDNAALLEAVQQIRAALRALARAQPPAQLATDDRMGGLGELFGIEGSASAAYYGVLGLLLKPPWQFVGRVRRPPTDPVNALLSFGYSLLTNQTTALIQAVGLDPGVGLLHQPGFGKPALALDIMEAFRPIIVDSVVITMINTGQLTPGDLEEELGAFRLRDRARRTFLEKFEERLNERIRHPVFGYQISYRRCIELQVRLLAKYAQGEIPRYVPFTVR
ncbi:CRISPR-associated endonuclease Cas1 [Kallotenue papyrolyticum]|uniref:CRISPR-associated endonuclease Cas1 n=1 Tax=Kallotenue papyrolyticum TaxID=1325125 RepID=UPI0009DE0186|nr:CRISPR-associated endonuclease Cas1 [Kallotenue papyrolyticum]